MKVTERFELFLSGVVVPRPPIIVIDGIVEFDPGRDRDAVVGVVDVDDDRSGQRGQTGRRLSCVPLAEQPPRAVTPPVGSSMIRFPLTTETVTVFTSPAAAV